jgi:FkbM family methyltransferase
MKGVGGYTRKEKLYIHPKNIGGHSIYQSLAGGGSDHIEIEIVDIAEELNRLNRRSLNLLKLDCEGAEYEILKRINSDMAKSIEKIVFEPTPSAYDVNELIDHLSNVGYQVERIKGMYLAQYQGLSA